MDWWNKRSTKEKAFVAFVGLVIVGSVIMGIVG